MNWCNRNSMLSLRVVTIQCWPTDQFLPKLLLWLLSRPNNWKSKSPYYSSYCSSLCLAFNLVPVQFLALSRCSAWPFSALGRTSARSYPSLSSALFIKFNLFLLALNGFCSSLLLISFLVEFEISPSWPPAVRSAQCVLNSVTSLAESRIWLVLADCSRTRSNAGQLLLVNFFDEFLPLMSFFSCELLLHNWILKLNQREYSFSLATLWAWESPRKLI